MKNDEKWWKSPQIWTHTRHTESYIRMQSMQNSPQQIRTPTSKPPLCPHPHSPTLTYTPSYIHTMHTLHTHPNKQQPVRISVFSQKKTRKKHWSLRHTCESTTPSLTICSICGALTPRRNCGQGIQSFCWLYIGSAGHVPGMAIDHTEAGTGKQLLQENLDLFAFISFCKVSVLCLPG